MVSPHFQRDKCFLHTYRASCAVYYPVQQMHNIYIYACVCVCVCVAYVVVGCIYPEYFHKAF